MSENRIDLRFAECLSEMRSIPEKSVDMVFCDLPYGKTRNSWDRQIDLPPLWEQYRRICSGAIVLTAQAPFDKILGASNIKRLRHEWVWEKTEATGHLNAKRAPMKAHENILVFSFGRITYNPQKTHGHTRKQSTAVRANDQSTNYGAQRGVTRYDSTERYPRSVIKLATDKQKLALHPTQKPLALVEYMVLTYSNADDTVLDNCMGSGTTGVACVNLGRKFIGIDNDSVITAVAEQRITAAINKESP